MAESKKRKKTGSNKPVVSTDEIPPSWTEGIKQSPRWYAPLAFILMGIGLLWIVIFYAISANVNLFGIGYWNLVGGFGFIMAGFIMLMWWK
ncbi:MAG: cell division protein CrgA [Actinomycetaceae bacterium]|nr:cell division protein CrgA [Actinomycetaceae bacterium]